MGQYKYNCHPSCNKFENLTKSYNFTEIMSIADIVPMLEFLREPENQEKMEEVGRIIFQNDSITVNVGAILALTVAAIIGGALLPSLLLGTGSDGGAAGGYGYGYDYSGGSSGAGYGDFAHSRSTASYSDVGNVVSNLVQTSQQSAAAGNNDYNALAGFWPKAVNNIANNLLN